MSRAPRPLALITLLLLSLCAASATAASYYDPPGRVARLSNTRGELSYSPAGEDGWYSAQRNRPLIRGDRLWTNRGALAEFQVGSAAVRLDQETSLDILELNDRLVQLEVSQGSVNLHVRRLYQGQEFEIATPSLAFVIDRPGNYRIDVDPRYGRTTVVVWQGSGVAYGSNGRFPVRAGDAVRFYGDDLSDYDMFGLPRADIFDRYCFDRDRRLDRSLSLRYLGDDVVGYSDLDEYGTWRTTPAYGNVWYPNQVGANWAPYRDGRWIWQEPWGWTWVDDAPWGFAPSHYGRWVNISNRWGWIPGPRDYRPVYAPALVVFIGGNGWGVSLSLGGGMSVGWFPLGPRDVYVPPYQASRNYFSQVNVSSTVINNTTINNVYNNYSSGSINVAKTSYANQSVADAITVVPATTLANSRPVRAAAIRVDRNKLGSGEFTRIAPVAPSMRSVLGADVTAKARPSREALDRPVFVRTPPPASELPFVEREKQLQQRPGRPLQLQPEPRPQDSAQRNIRVIRSKDAAVDMRATGPRRVDATTPAQAPTTKPLDRSIERRPPPMREPQQRPGQQQDNGPQPMTPPAQGQMQTPEQRQAEARQQMATRQAEQAKAAATRDEQAAQAAQLRKDQAQAREQAQADNQAQAQARADAQAKARLEAQSKADAQAKARLEAQSQADAQAKARAEAQAQAQADARARAEAQQQAREDARAQAEARAQQQAQAQARAQEQAQQQAQAREDAQAQAQARAQAQAEARAQQQAQAEARAEAQRAKAQADAQARAEAQGQPPAETQAQGDAAREPRTKARRPPNCLTAEEVDALKKSTAEGQALPAYVPCKP